MNGEEVSESVGIIKLNKCQSMDFVSEGETNKS